MVTLEEFAEETEGFESTGHISADRTVNTDPSVSYDDVEEAGGGAEYMDENSKAPWFPDDPDRGTSKEAQFDLDVPWQDVQASEVSHSEDDGFEGLPAGGDSAGDPDIPEQPTFDWEGEAPSQRETPDPEPSTSDQPSPSAPSVDDLPSAGSGGLLAVAAGAVLLLVAALGGEA